MKTYSLLVASDLCHFRMYRYMHLRWPKQVERAPERGGSGAFSIIPAPSPLQIRNAFWRPSGLPVQSEANRP